MINFSIDGEVLAHQPLRCDFEQPQPEMRTTARGLTLARRRRGRRVTVAWGETFVPPGVVQEMRARLQSGGRYLLEHTLAWTEPDGSSVSLDVVLDVVESEFSQVSPGFYNPLTLTFWERTPARTHQDEGVCTALVRLDEELSLNLSGSVQWALSGYLGIITGTAGARIAFMPWDGSAIGAVATSAGVSQDVALAFHPDGTKVAIGNQLARTVTVYEFTGGNLGTLLDVSPVYGASGSIAAMEWSPLGNYIAVSHTNTTTRHLAIYPWDGATLGTPIIPASGEGPASTPVIGQGIAWMPDESAIAICYGTTAAMNVYPFTGSALSTPIVQSAFPGLGGSDDVAFRPGGQYLAVSLDNDPFVCVFPWDGSALGIAIAPTMVSPGAGNSTRVRWSRGGNTLWVVGINMDDALALYGYDFAGNVFGARCDASPQPSGTVKRMELSSDNRYLAVSSTTDDDLDVYATSLNPV